MYFWVVWTLNVRNTILIHSTYGKVNWNCGNLICFHFVLIFYFKISKLCFIVYKWCMFDILKRIIERNAKGRQNLLVFPWYFIVSWDVILNYNNTSICLMISYNSWYYDQKHVFVIMIGLDYWNTHNSTENSVFLLIFSR